MSLGEFGGWRVRWVASKDPSGFLLPLLRWFCFEVALVSFQPATLPAVMLHWATASALNADRRETGSLIPRSDVIPGPKPGSRHREDRESGH